MRILLDTKDLINVVERNQPATLEEFARALRSGSHTLVISFSSICEFCAPVLNGGDLLEMRRNLQRLEQLPLTYIREAYIPYQEIASALASFESQRDYEPVDPYVSRWDDTVQPPWVSSATRMFVRYRIDEAVIDILHTNPNAIIGTKRNIENYTAIVDSDRALTPRPSHADQFARTVERHLTRYPVSPLPDVRAFAAWIYADARRCPGLRLIFDKYNLMRGDGAHRPQGGDFSDFAHILAVPYVDAATFDRRVAHLASRSIERLNRRHGVQYDTVIAKSTAELLRRM